MATMKLDDVQLPSFSKSIAKKAEYSVQEQGIQTTELQVKEVGVDSITFPSVEVQTDEENVELPKNLSISTATLSTFEKIFATIDKEHQALKRLEPFLVPSAAKLQLTRSIAITAIPSGALPVQSIVAGPADRVALLCAEPVHESWCAHTAHVVVVQYGKQYSLPLAVCPSAAAWGPRGLLAVATVDGRLQIFLGTDLLASAQLHVFPITGLSWTSNQLISSAADGSIVISSMTGNEIRVDQELNIPITGRRGKQNASTKPPSICAMSRQGDKVILATDTGALWNLQLSSMALTELYSSPRAIQSINALPSGDIIVLDDDSSLYIFKAGGSLEPLSSTGNWLISLGNLIMTGDSTSISILDPARSQQLLSQKLQTSAVCSQAYRRLAIFTPANTLDLFQVYT